MVQIFQKYYYRARIRIIYSVLLIFSLLLYISNFKYLYYVTIIGYSINDVIVNSIGYGIGEISGNNYIEKTYPIIIYLMITINVIVCCINVFTKSEA
jgi:hypothetical protein